MWRSSLGLLLLLKGVECGQYCKQYVSEYTYWYTTYYCDGRCCGSIYDDDCCEDRSGHIAAAVIGGIIGFIILISVIICIVKACTKQKTGRVIGPSSGLFIVSGSSHYGRHQNNGHSGTYHIPQPPPYTAGPAPPYSPYDRFDPGPSRIRSPPPAYTRTVQTTIGGSSSPAGESPVPSSSSPAVRGVSSNPGLHSLGPQPAVTSVSPNPGLNSLAPAGSVPMQDSTGRLPANAPPADSLPVYPAETNGTGRN